MNYYDNGSGLVNWNPSYTPTYTYSLGPKEDMGECDHPGGSGGSTRSKIGSARSQITRRSDREADMEAYHTADEFTIVRQANKMGGITVGYTYFKITKIPADEANFYKDSASDKS